MNRPQYNDTYKSGEPMDQLVLGGGQKDVMPMVKWTLPDGARLTTTLREYNRQMPFLFKHEAKWRNAINIAKRAKMGLTEQDRMELAEFEKIKKDYFSKLAKGENQQ